MKSKERPILFNGAMIQAIMAGKKTQTRRVVKPLCGCPDFFHIAANEPYPYYFRRKDAVWDSFKTMDELAAKYSPYGKVGDRLWVRETWRPAWWDGDFDFVGIEHRANSIEMSAKSEDLWADDDRRENMLISLTNECVLAGLKPDEGGSFRWDQNPLKWRPSIFMPRAACRSTLDIVGVRIERLQDISEEDAIAEGVGSRKEYHALWDSINEERGYGWDSNPLVWVVEFPKIQVEKC